MPAPARSDAVVGKWRLRWTRQASVCVKNVPNPLQKALASNVKNWQVVHPSGRLAHTAPPPPHTPTLQGATANPLQKTLASNVKNWQVVYPTGRLDNLVEFAPWLRVRARAAAAPEGPARTGVVIEEVRVELGPLK